MTVLARATTGVASFTIDLHDAPTPGGGGAAGGAAAGGAAAGGAPSATIVALAAPLAGQDVVLQNEYVRLVFGGTSGRLASMTNKVPRCLMLTALFHSELCY